MTMNRRQFATRLGMAVTLASLPACWFNDVYKTIAQYIPLALLAFDKIVAILLEHGVDVSGLTGVIDRVKAALADVQTAILAYRDAAADAKANLLAALHTALRIAADRLTEFWESLQISNEQLRRTIKMLLDVIVSTIEGFIWRLPPAQGLAARAPEPKYGPVPQVRSLKEFRHDFNRVLRERGEAQFAI